MAVKTDNILIAQERFHGLRTNKSCKKEYMAVKTDMSKAYDRIEWHFIEHLLRKMGFSEKWITWMMWCIQSVQYKVLINGQPRGHIIPHRGLRQGDPLSPYLFILCTEVLIANLRKAEQRKQITGLKIARACPPVSHMLFADDSLFFCKATKEETVVLLNILKQYESVSGQQINFAKSSVQFGHTVDATIRAEIHQTLGILNVGGMGTYLGIPESLGGAKTKIFSFLIERQQQRVNGWTSRLLSKGGKEVLIKSVASALPTYVMSCFRLPKAITAKLTSTVSRFWWSTSGNTRGMHWLAWKKLCRRKSEGGLGFRIIEDFNTALLAKQLWRLIDNPKSLFAKVFKGRYFRNTGPLDHIRSYSASYGWKSITSARSLVKKGLIKRVGSGNSISVWNDPWIPAHRPRSATCKGYNFYPELTVNQLIDPLTSTWNLVLIEQLVVAEDIPLIVGIPTTKEIRPDLQNWHFTKTGRYTVKSGYNTEQEFPTNGNIPIFYGPDITHLQGHTWKVKCPPKIKHFLWQILSGCISVMDRLHNRGINCDPQCARCGAERETINHTLFECPPSLQVWALSVIPTSSHGFPTEGLYTNMAYLFWELPRTDEMTVFP